MIARYLKQLKQPRKLLVNSVAAVLLGTCSFLPAAVGASAAASKPQVQVPATAQTTLQAPIASKSQATPNAAAEPHVAYTASLSASPMSLWPTQYTTLTAVTNQDITYTPYYLDIYDVTAGVYVKICGTGTSCSVSVTQPTATTHTYRAYVSGYPYTYPPASIQATSSNVSVTWMSLGTLTLSASPTTLGVGGTTTLTAVNTVNVTPTPFYIEIFDATTGARLVSCPFGTVCSTTTSQAVATTHKFIAYTSYNTAPATNIQNTSNPSYVTWTPGGYRLSLTATGTTLGHANVTAYSNINVGPTPYYIEIFNLRTGAFVTACGSGTSCTAYNVALSYGRNDFVAFTSSYSTTLPPANIQASSNIATQYFFLPIPRP